MKIYFLKCSMQVPGLKHATPPEKDRQLLENLEIKKDCR